ncbi:MAG: DNA topoisomerase I [Candidatus Micrarchaeota archaeon]
MELIVAEKPKVAYTIAKAIGGEMVQRSHGKARYYEITKDGKEYAVAPAVGHLYNLAEVKKSHSYPVFDVEWKPSYQISRFSYYTKDYTEALLALGKKAERVTVACDYDIEGCLPASEQILIEGEEGTTFERVGDFVDKLLENGKKKEWNGFEYVEVDGLKVPSIEPESLGFGYKQVKKVMRRKGTGKVLKITLQHGKEICVTPNHPTFVFGKNGLVVKKAALLAAGDYVPTAIRMPKNARERKQLDLVEEAMRLGQANRFYIYGFSKINRKMPAEVAKTLHVSRKTALGWRFWDRIPLWAYLKLEEKKEDRKALRIGVRKGKTRTPCIIPLGRELGKLAGYYLAEGCIDSSGFVGFYFGPTEMDLVNEVEEILRKKLLISDVKKRVRKARGQFGNAITPEIGTKSKMLAFLFGDVLKLGRGSHKKNLPDFIISSPAEFRAGILDGYLLGDGSAFISKKDNRCVVSAGSVSRELMKRMHILLLSFGINSALVRQKKKDVFYLVIGVSHEIKKLFDAGAASVIDRKGLHKDVLRIADSGTKRKDLAACLPNFMLDECKLGKQTLRNIKFGGQNARTSKESIVKGSEFVNKLKKSEVLPLRILRIEECDYDGYVYDLETETGSFMHGDGIITHNSLIGYNVYRFCYGGENGGRMKFSSLVASELAESFENREGSIDFNNAFAGEARHIIDWYYGINLSRALMGALRKAGGFRTMSIGRVQGPALDILAKREKEIAAFVPQDYWEIRTWLKGTEFLHEAGRFMEAGEAEAVYGKIAKGMNATIENVEKKEVEAWAYPPFDLTSLQLEAYGAFGFPPALTLALAQTLYEGSLISYPRTSSQKLPAKLGLARIIDKLSGNPEYATHAKILLEKKWFRPREGKKEDPAHPAIHPTGMQPGKLSEQEKKLYDLIVRRFLSCFAPPAKIAVTKIKARAGGEGFDANGSHIVEKGWIEFYPYYKSKEKAVAAFANGENTPIEEKKKEKKQTKPPNRYSPASIISELEKKHLGTKATRAVIVDTLFKRGYAEGRSIEVSPFGMRVWEVLATYSPKILDEKLTRKLEDDMEMVVGGRMGKEVVIEEGKEILIQILDDFKRNEEKIGKELLASVKQTEAESAKAMCPLCGKPLRVIRMKTGKQFVGCTGYPDCRNAYPVPFGAYVQLLEKKCPECGGPMAKIRRTGRAFEMCLVVNCKSKANWGKRKEEKEEKAKEAAKKEEGAEKKEKKPRKKAAPKKKKVNLHGLKAVASS